MDSVMFRCRCRADDAVMPLLVVVVAAVAAVTISCVRARWEKSMARPPVEGTRRVIESHDAAGTRNLPSAGHSRHSKS